MGVLKVPLYNLPGSQNTTTLLFLSEGQGGIEQARTFEVTKIVSSRNRTGEFRYITVFGKQVGTLSYAYTECGQ
jgi:hypothetical protein